MTSPAGKPATIMQKARRKISLPWFKQTSSAAPHPALSRQHTIDTPGSFQARLLRQQPSLSQTGVPEITWVVADHTAASGTRELSVTKGQAVEVLESEGVSPEWTLVRLVGAPGQTSGEAAPEGLVPTRALQQPPSASCKTSPSRKVQAGASMSQQLSVAVDDSEILTSDASVSANTSSPGNKRRGFGAKKWLPPPLRNLKNKVDKSTPPPPPPPPPPPQALFHKTNSDKRFKLPNSNESAAKAVEADEKEENRDAAVAPTFVEQNGAEDADDELELPPPMKPITEPILVSATAPGSTSADDLPGKRATALTSERVIKSDASVSSVDLAEIELAEIIKEKMEQHTENRERQSSQLSCSPSEDYEGGAAEGLEDPETVALRRRQYVIKELVDTERDYVNDLRQIVEGYLALMRDPECDIPLPEDLRGGKDKMVFGNIEVIYEWHRDSFFESLKACLEKPEDLGSLFKRCERKLHMYVIYCQNKPVSEYIVSEYMDTYFEELRQKLGHRLQLCDLLIKPVQRITKYQLLVSEALRLTEKTGRISEIESLRDANHVMKIIPKAANDMMDVGRLQGFDGKITAQGKLLLHGPLIVTELASMPSRGRECQVFLFEQNIIFSEAVGKKTQFTNPAYTYKAQIQVNKMSLEDCPDDPDRFIIRSTDPRKPGLGYACSTPEDVGPRRNEWVKTLSSLLEKQRDFLKAIQSPIAYQKELTRDPLRATSSKTVEKPLESYKDQMNLPRKSNPRTPSPTKSKLNFLEGFRNTLRTRSPVRQSTSTVTSPGTKVHLDADWSQESSSSRQESPTSLSPNSSSGRAWSFRSRKSTTHQSVSSPRSPSPSLSTPNNIDSNPKAGPIVIRNLQGFTKSDNDRSSGSNTIWARILDSNRIQVHWEDRKNGPYDVEYRSVPSLNWTLGAKNVDSPPVVLELLPGTSYSFRVVSKNNLVCSASPVVNLPLGESTSWEAEQFTTRYLELDEIGKGRFAKVRRARDRGTGQEVALKQSSRLKQSRSLTRAEYELLASVHHGNIIRAFALFENAPQSGIDTIVLELVRGPTLLVYLSKKTEYSESMISKYTNQLLSALQWLHQREKAHLDVKPENVLVDEKTGIIKLIDLGDAVRHPIDEVVPPVDLEFAAPESVLGRPVGSYTDMWAAGVFIYVLLSGLSPFLDDSIEETTANILKCDFCFPDEYFAVISNEAKDLLQSLLCLAGENRASAERALASPWFKVNKGATISASRMVSFTERRALCLKSRPEQHLYS